MPSLSLTIAGLHGQIGVGLTARHAANYAAALGTHVEGRPVLVAADTRDSTPMLKNAAVAALLACGCEVLDAGICPAPVAHFQVRRLGAAAGLLIGGCHHPAGWNALQPINHDGACYSPVQAQSLLDLYDSQRHQARPWDQVGELRVLAEDDGVAAYLDHLLAHFDREAIAARCYTVVADLCNGSGGPLLTALAERLNLRLIAINDSRAGFLPHDPEPRPRASVQVQALMAPLGAHLGVVYNSDLTRLAVVTDSGETLSEEYTFPLVAQRILARLPPGATVVTNICSTRSLDDVVAAHGGVLEKTRVGQAQVVDRMLELHAQLGGEGCGSVALPAVGPYYGGAMVLTTLLEAMAVAGASATALSRQFPRYALVKRSIPCPTAHGYSLVHRLRDAFPDAVQNDIDGLRFDWPDGWAHVRVSATEPSVRLIAEAGTRAAVQELASKVHAQLERQVQP